MSTSVIAASSAKPRLLIADDSRIVRATLIKHIEGKFDFREALDGEEAWEKLLIDPEIRVVITDLTMPKLDGYGLLKRIRASKISRIRDLPVVVISGSDEQAERDRAKSFGATDLITKGIGTVQLLSRLDVLSQLAAGAVETLKEAEVPAQMPEPVTEAETSASETFYAQADEMRAAAVALNRNFVLLSMHVADGDAAGRKSPDPEIAHAVERFLQQTIRQTDCMSRVGDVVFVLATGNIQFDSARNFAQRVCSAIVSADWVKEKSPALVVSCGLASLSEYEDGTAATISLQALIDMANRRASTGLRHSTSGVVGPEEEAKFIEAEAAAMQTGTCEEAPLEPPPDLPTLLQWAKEGKKELVMQHIGHFSEDLQPLIAMLQK